jgi:hypothetical protein
MKKFGFVIWFLFFAACSGKNSAPGDIVQKDTMRNIMWDMIQADQYAKLYVVKDSCTINVKDETIKLYQQVFQIHHVTKDEFDKSYKYYLAHQDLNKLVFDSLSAQILRERHQPTFTPKPKPLLRPIPKPAK